MKRVPASFCVAVCAAACSIAQPRPCLAQANPWDGAWKIDASTMKYSGPPMTFKTDAEGYTVTRGGVTGPKVICDAAPHDVHGSTLTCTKQGAGYAVEVSRDGKTVTRVTMSMAPDGKTAKRVAERFSPDGKSSTMTNYAERVSGSDTAIDGDWKETGFSESNDTGILNIKVTGDSISFQETDSDAPLTCKLDGTPTPTGDGRTLTIKLADPHTLKVTYSAGGKVQRENIFILSSDSKSIAETDHTPAPEESTMQVKFNRS